MPPLYQRKSTTTTEQKNESKTTPNLTNITIPVPQRTEIGTSSNQAPQIRSNLSGKLPVETENQALITGTISTIQPQSLLTKHIPSQIYSTSHRSPARSQHHIEQTVISNTLSPSTSPVTTNPHISLSSPKVTTLTTQSESLPKTSSNYVTPSVNLSTPQLTKP